MHIGRIALRGHWPQDRIARMGFMELLVYR